MWPLMIPQLQPSQEWSLSLQVWDASVQSGFAFWPGKDECCAFVSLGNLQLLTGRRRSRSLPPAEGTAKEEKLP